MYGIDDDNENINPDRKYEINRIKSAQLPDLGEEVIHYGPPGGGNSGYQAINLAYILGAKTILLLGFDMFGSHFFGDHPDKLNVNSPYKHFIKGFESINQKKVEIINCTRQTALNCFPLKFIDNVL